MGDQFSGYGIANFICGYAFLLAGILAIVLGSMLERRFLKPEQGAAGKILWLSLLQTVAQYMFFYIGLAHTSGVKASIIEAVNVFVAILVSGCLFRQETIHARQMIGCLIGFAGVVLINLNGVDFHMQANGEDLSCYRRLPTHFHPCS